MSLELTKQEADFVASALLYIHKLGRVWTPEQDREGRAIVDKLAGAKG